MKQADREADRPPNADIISTSILLIESLIEYNPIVRPNPLSEAAHKYRDQIEELITTFESLPGLSDGCEAMRRWARFFSRLL